jgi:hypothetical protein
MLEANEDVRFNKLKLNLVQRFRLTDSVTNIHTNIMATYPIRPEWDMSSKCDLYWLNNGKNRTIKNQTSILFTKGNFSLSTGPLLIVAETTSLGIHIREKLEIKNSGSLNLFFESIPTPELKASIEWYI